MKPLLLTFFFILSFSVFGQTAFLLKQVDSIVLTIDKTQSTYKFRAVRYNYEYKKQSTNIVKIVRRFQKGITNVEQVFYLRNSKLFFATEKEISYYLHNDSIGWGGKYYFQNNKLKFYETLGHGKSETADWNPEVEVLVQFNKAKRDIAYYLKKKAFKK